MHVLNFRPALPLAGAVLLAAIASGTAAQAAAPNCLGIPADRIGMQLYSVATELRPPGPPLAAGAPRPAPPPVDPVKLDSVLAALSGIGWRNIENYSGNWGIGDAGYKAVLDRHQLKSVAAHEATDDAGWTAVLDRAKALGQTHVGSGNYGQPGLDTLEHVLQTAAHLNALGAQASARGLKFYVHSHRDEFTNTFSYDVNGDGRAETATAWEIVAAKTDPRHVTFEVDVHWARVALGIDKFEDLLAFLQKYRARITLLHIKDTSPTGEIADLGRGTTDWRRLVSAAGPQVAYYLWEFDRPPNPLQSAKVAYDYITCAR